MLEPVRAASGFEPRPPGSLFRTARGLPRGCCCLGLAFLPPAPPPSDSECNRSPGSTCHSWLSAFLLVSSSPASPLAFAPSHQYPQLPPVQKTAFRAAQRPRNSFGYTCSSMASPRVTQGKAVSLWLLSPHSATLYLSHMGAARARDLRRGRGAPGRRPSRGPWGLPQW